MYREMRETGKDGAGRQGVRLEQIELGLTNRLTRTVIIYEEKAHA